MGMRIDIRGVDASAEIHKVDFQRLLLDQFKGNLNMQIENHMYVQFDTIV